MPENIDDIVRLLQGSTVARPYVVGHYDEYGRRVSAPSNQSELRRSMDEARMTVEEIQPEVKPEPQKVRVEIEGRNLDDL